MTIFVPAARVSRIKVSPTTAASARVRELKSAGRDIVDMTIGEPDFDTPDHIKASAHEAIDRGETKYTPVNGTVSLRKAIIADYKRRLGLAYADNQICVGIPFGTEVDVPFEVQYAGPAPTLVAGVSQINFRIAPFASYGAIYVHMGSTFSPGFTIHVAGQ